MLHVRGGGDAVAAILQFTRPNKWSAFDCSTGAFIDLENPSHEGWEGLQTARDEAVDALREEGD
jgi:hypothetical protein